MTNFQLLILCSKIEHNMDDKEFRIIDIISNNYNLSQREISRRAGLSIGTVNIILHNLIRKGYIKMRQLNRRKVAYILTPQGFHEKARKTYRYMKRLLNDMNRIKDKIKQFILQKYEEGYRHFYLTGDGEVAFLFELCIAELNLEDIYLHKNEMPQGERYVIINCGEEQSREIGTLHISEIV